LALTQYFKFPLAGLWAVLTAVVVTQVSVGGSLKATVEYLVGTLGGAVYAGAIAALVPHSDEVALLAVLALAVAPLSLLAAVNPNFRVGPFTAVIVVLGTAITHTDPVQSALYRVIEVSLGGAIGLAVSFLVLPARAHNLAIDAAAGMLEALARALPKVFAGLRQERNAMQVLQLQDSVGAAFARFYAISTDVKGEQMARLKDLGGPLAVEGTVKFTDEPGVVVDGLVAPRSTASQDLQNQLRILGTPDAQGRRPFSFATTF